MSRHNSTSSHSRSNHSEHSFPFEGDDDTVAHPALLPNGILNDEDEDDVVPAWPRKSSVSERATASSGAGSGSESGAVLQCRKLPQDLTAREFAGLFTFADGYLESTLKDESGERIGTSTFNSSANAAKARAKMASVAAYKNVVFNISSSQRTGNGVDMPTPPATLSTSSKSTGSSGSMQHSRLSSYVKEKMELTTANHPAPAPSTSFGMDEIFSSSMPKSSGGIISSSVPTNFSTSAGGTVWSPTSPRFATVGGDLAKSPPAGFSMLPPPSAKEDDGWSRSTTARFAGMSITGEAARSLGSNGSTGLSPTLSHGFPSIDKSLGSQHLNGNAPSFAKQQQQTQSHGPAYTAAAGSMGFNSPPKHNGMMANTPYATMNPAASGFVMTNRLGPALINTNPADQNPPCNTLYVGNLPLATTEEELKSLFSRQQGYRRLCYRTKSNGPMCFVEFEDVHYAIQALKLLQGVILSSSIKGGIRLSFSKNPLGVRKMDTVAQNGLMPGMMPPGPMHGPGQAMLGGHGLGHVGQGGPPPPHGMNGYAPHAPPGLMSGTAPGQAQNKSAQQPQQQQSHMGAFGQAHAHQQQQQHSMQPQANPIWQ